MEKILVTGDVDGYFNNVCEALGKEYEVINCEFGMLNISRSIRINAPKMVLFIKKQSIQSVVVKEVRENYPSIPMIIICEGDDVSLQKHFGSSITCLRRPVSVKVIKEKVAETVGAVTE